MPQRNIKYFLEKRKLKYIYYIKFVPIEIPYRLLQFQKNVISISQSKSKRNFLRV